MKTTIFCIGALALLTACGGGTDTSPFPPMTTVAGCSPRVVTVALLGDSTMFQTEGRVQSVMDAEFGAGAVVVTNDAVSGTTSSQAPHVVADVVVANYGINDDRLGVPVATFSANMAAMGITLVETQNPMADRTTPEAQFVAADLSLGLPVADTNAYVLGLPNWQSMLVDGVHPSSQLYDLIVDDVLAPAVAKQVAPLRCLSFRT